MERQRVNCWLVCEQEERAAHGETKSKLLDTQDKLAFCQGEVEVLARQIDREKMQFDQT